VFFEHSSMKTYSSRP